MTLRNRQLKRTHPKHLVQVTLRAVPMLYGKPRYDNVKVVLSDPDGLERMYFARCVAFISNSKGAHFVLLRWYTSIGRYASELIPMLPHLRLAPPFLTQSYDVLPVDCILNGALLVPNAKDYWAMMSPRELLAYEAMNSI